MKKYKKLPLILGSLAGVSLFTAGFAGWVIVNNQGTVADGLVDITVGEVVDKRLTATISEIESNIVFDSNKDGGDNGFNGTGANEDLVFGATVKVVFTDTNNVASSIGSILNGFKFEAELTGDKVTDFQNCLKSNYIVSPFEEFNSGTVTKTTYELTTAITDYDQNKQINNSYETGNKPVLRNFDYSTDSVKKEATLKFKFGFNWGSVFKNVNPCETVWDETNTLDKGLEALKVLYGLNGANDLLKLTITPIVK